MRLGLRHRPALAVAVMAFAIALALARQGLGLHWRSSVLGGWCASATVYAGLLTHHLLRATPEAMRSRAERLDDSRLTVLGLSLAAAFAALAGVVWEIGAAGPGTPWAVPLGLGTILVSWVFVHLLFAHLYAHDYLLSGGLEFPGDAAKRPDGFEFLYFSLTIGMTCQVSDVTTSSPRMRRLVLAHGLVSFVFNAAFVAAAVNLLSGLASR